MAMQKWKYHSMVCRDLSIVDGKLNAEGDKGWELVSVVAVDSNTARVFFKQPVPEEAPLPEDVEKLESSPM